MWLVILLVIVIAAVIVCFSLAAAAKNAEMISQLWLEKQRIKQEILCTNKTKDEQKMRKSRYTFDSI